MTDDVLRSIAVSQRAFGTQTVYVMAHSDCGLRAAGLLPPLDEHVRRSVRRVRQHEAVPHRDDVHGCILDLETGAVTPVHPA